MMDTNVDWDQLVDALRDELQEKGGLIRLLNQQTETLYRGDAPENERLEEQIRVQLRTISRCTQSRELALRQDSEHDAPDLAGRTHNADPHGREATW